MGASIWSPGGGSTSGTLTRITYDLFSALPGQTAFTLIDATAVPGSNNVFVVVDGIFYPFTEFTVGGAKLITLNVALVGGEAVLFVAIEATVLGSPLTDAQVADLLAQAIALATQTATVIAASSGLANYGLEVIAHRGFQTQFPQNTLLAMSSARRRGASSLECDVRVSLDGVPILYHDANLNTLTSGAGDPATVTLAYMQGLTFNALVTTPFSATKIPTFADFLTYTRSQNIRTYAEIKAYRTQADIALMVDAIEVARMERLCMLVSFTYSDLEYVRTLTDIITIGFVGASYVIDYESYVDALVLLGNATIVWDLADLILRPSIVSYAQTAGIDVIAYTITTTNDALTASKLGVRRVISNVSLEQ